MSASRTCLSNKMETEPDWLKKQREDAFQRYQQVPPEKTKRHIGRALNLSGLDLALIKDKINDNIKTGNIQSEISYDRINENKIEIIGLRDGLERIGPLKNTIKIDETLFSNKRLALFNSALWNSGLLIHAKSRMDLKNPVRIDMKIKDSSIEQMFILAEPDSSLFLLVNQSSELCDSAESCYHGCNTHIYAGENSRIKLCILQNHSPNLYHFRFQTALLEKKASVEMIEINAGGCVGVSEFSALLQGESSNTSIFSIFCGSGSQQFDLRSTAVHEEKSTISNMLTRGILNDASQAIYRGLIRMKKDGVSSIGNQRADTILLSSDANADARPVLEIQNNDVKCSHGVSIGKIDNEKLFYMMSRGISRDEAVRTYILGFLEPILMKIPEKERDYVLGILSEKMKRKMAKKMVVQHGA